MRIQRHCIYTWGDEMRGLRADELLSTGRRFTIVDMMQFQHDELSIPARNLVPLLTPLEFSEPREKEAASQLKHWDFVVSQKSIAAAVYVSFERRLLENVRQLVIPQATSEFFTRLNKKRVIDWLVAPDGRFGDNPLDGRDTVLVKSLSQAVAELTERLGSDISRWQYGQKDFKHVLIRHPLSAAVDKETRVKLDVGPAPRGGYDSTLNNTSNSNNQRSGATFRVIMDAANWDNSVATSAPGQSGDPSSPHYRDLFELWIKHQYFPLFYSRAKIESVTQDRLVLQPPQPQQE